MRFRSRVPSLLSAAVVLAVLLAVVPPSLAAHSEPSTDIGALGPSNSGSSLAAPHPGGAREARALAGANCTALAQEFAAVDPALAPPTPLAALQSPCHSGADESALSFLTNSSFGEDRAEFNLSLPAGTSDPEASLSSWATSIWVKGISCSVEGASLLELVLTPPYGSVGAEANWTVGVHVWDLVAPGSCDPKCQNDTAFLTILGANFCEDDVLVGGPGALSAPIGSFGPSDVVSVTLWATPGTPGVDVWANDTTQATRSVHWSSTSDLLVNGGSLSGIASNATVNRSFWGYPQGASVIVTNCPTPGSNLGAPTCVSYDSSRPTVSSVPQLLAAHSWDATHHGFTSPFAEVATSSTTAGCRAGPASCADFTTFGGNGAYPLWSLNGAAGAASWSYGTPGPSSVSTFGGAAGEFPLPSGEVTGSGTALSSVTAVAASGNETVRFRATSLAGVAAASVSAYWCFGGGAPSAVSVTAQLSLPSLNSSADGNWTAVFPLGGKSGTFAYSVDLSVNGGSTATTGWKNDSTGGGSTCSDPTPSTPTGLTTVAEASGVELSWNENDTGLSAFNVSWTVAPHGPNGSAVVAPVNSTRIDLGSGGLVANVTVRAVSDAGKISSPATVKAVASLSPLSISLAALGASLPVTWGPGASVPVQGSVAGGAPPYELSVEFGDGTQVSAPTSSNFSDVHAYAPTSGVALIEASVQDALGSTAGPFLELAPIGSTPLGVPVSTSAGDGYVNVSWLPPISLAGPVTHYTVYATERSDRTATLTATWPVNATSLQAGVELLTTSRTYVLLAVADGATLYTAVVAWDAYGASALPAGSPPPLGVAIPAPLSIASVSAPAGGAAPLHATFSAVATSGTNDTVSNAIYSLSNGTFTPAAVQYVPPSTIYLNGSLTLDRPGFVVVTLHVDDTFNDVAITSIDLFVSSPARVGAAAESNTTVAWAGSPVAFHGNGSGGSGQYGYLWTFGDGQTGNGSDVVHTYTMAGTFTATVQVTDSSTGVIAFSSVIVDVYAPPTISISTTASNASGSFDFSAVVAGGDGAPSVRWVFGDGTVARGLTANHTFAPGRFTVNATVVEAGGRSSTASIVVAVPGTGGGPSTASTALPWALVGALSVLSALSLGGFLYAWRRGPTTGSTERSPESTDDDDEADPFKV